MYYAKSYTKNVMTGVHKTSSKCVYYVASINQSVNCVHFLYRGH